MMLPIESSCLIGNWMPENSVAKPAGPDEVEEEFMETLRQAAFIFEREKDGRFHGSILACKAVVRFIYHRGGGAELAGPFLQIAAAGIPKQISGKVSHRKWSRLPRRLRLPAAR